MTTITATTTSRNKREGYYAGHIRIYRFTLGYSIVKAVRHPKFSLTKIRGV